jgi:restriction system protein
MAEENVISTNELIEPLAEIFQISEEELHQILPSGRVRRVVDRISWAITFLNQAKLIQRVSRARYAITDDGRAVLADPPEEINLDYLKSNENFKNFRETKKAKKPAVKRVAAPIPVEVPVETENAEELINAAFRELEDKIFEQVKAEIVNLSPQAFAKLAMEVVQTLRYGSHDAEDEPEPEILSVKNMIIRDPLGLDSIYLRASHQTMDKVKGPEIGDFIKSMGSVRKGIYITDGTFTDDVISLVKSSTKIINLIDLNELAKIMLKYNIGLRIYRQLDLKKVDREFFSELGE